MSNIHTSDKPSDFDSGNWKDILKRVKEQIQEDHLQITAAGIAFYFFLALFPAMAAFVSIYSMWMDPAQIQEHLESLRNVMPGKAHELIVGIVEPVSKQSSTSLGWSSGLSLLFTLYSANKGTKAIFKGVNIAYHESDDRGFLKKNLISVGMTLGYMIIGILSLGIIVLFPAFVDQVLGDSSTARWMGILRWVLILIIVILTLAVTYKVAPDRDNAKFRWLSWGAGIATVLWLIGSLLFSYYVNNFGNYGETYGSFASVIILMLWFFLTAFVLLLGAEINAEMEHETARDTTVGEEEPMGSRGAYFADRKAE